MTAAPVPWADLSGGSPARRTATAVATGVGLGLTNAAAFRTAGRGIGVTTAFESAAAAAQRDLRVTPARVNRYLQDRDTPPKFGWEAWLIAGTLVGGLLDARFGGPSARAAVNRPAWAAFTGGALAMFGARMAGGCTSGHCLTWTAQLATSSWAFSAVLAGTAGAAGRLLRGRVRGSTSTGGQR